MPNPIQESNRIQSLDVLRGFALLGILLLNIIGFGLLSPAYFNPGFDVSVSSTANVLTWASVELLAEGAMRGLFSMLFGAGVVLFTTGAAAKGAAIYYKRNFWLLMFGLVNAYLLLWSGDILVTYAIVGALLYFVRHLGPKALLVSAGLLILLMSLFYGALGFALKDTQHTHEQLLATENPETVTAEVKSATSEWQDFIQDIKPPEEVLQRELTERTTSYTTAFSWNALKATDMLISTLPMFLFWDALAMMLIGMALYKLGILQGKKTPDFYLKLMVAGFSIGLLSNSYEIARSLQANFAILQTFAALQPTYHIGRLAMALGYLGLIMWLLQHRLLPTLSNALGFLGRMALSNYLMHSLICAILFTGLGFGLLGKLSRAELYPIVLAIWVFQLVLSQWWLKRFAFGPVEWLWRALTYGHKPPFYR